MLETTHTARRHAALPFAAETFRSRTVSIATLPAAIRFSLRARSAAAATLGPVAGLQLDCPINRMAAADERWAARLGPDEWLIVAPEDETDGLAAEIEAALGHHAHSLVDISHRHVAIEMAGENAAAALNAGCPLDLDPRTFPAGSATRTLLGKAEIVLARPGDAPVFRVECGRSFAAYVHGFLEEAARDV